MGCFPACFTSSNRRKHQASVAVAPSILPKHQIHEATEEAVQFEPTKLDSINANVSRKVYEEKTKNDDEKKVLLDLVEVKIDEKAKEMEPTLGSTESSGANVVPAHASSYRYENCSISEDEDESLINFSGSDLNGDDYDDGNVEKEAESNKRSVIQEQESSESLFSISISSKKRGSDAEEDEKEVNSPMPEAMPVESDQCGDRSQHCPSVLRPTENLSQQKDVETKATPSDSEQQEKGNVNAEQVFNILISPETTLKLSKLKLMCDDINVIQETAVDTSLSSWLVECKPSPMPNGSEHSVGNIMCEGKSLSIRLGDRPVLGAWTNEELKQLSNSTTPNQTPSLSADQLEKRGTVGSYWCHTGQATDSDSNSLERGKENATVRSTEDKEVKCKTTPLDPKLGRVLDLSILGI